MSYRLVRILFILLYLRQVASNEAEETSKTSTSTTQLPTHSSNISDNKPSECKDFDPNFVKCQFNTTCIYGEPSTVECHVDEEIPCKGDRTFSVTFPCLYCWQIPENFYSCIQNSTCKPNTKYLTTCIVNSTTYCLGHREFSRYKQCNVVTGHKWSMAAALSILFGGFGVDRFYLGHWQEGVGKLFSFGGFGVWTLIDTILISIGYLKPADSSQYEY